MPERQKIECPKGAQLYVAVSILSASIGIPAIPSSSMNILQNSASSRQSIPGLRPAPSSRGDAFHLISTIRGAFDLYAPLNLLYLRPRCPSSPNQKAPSFVKELFKNHPKIISARHPCRTIFQRSSWLRRWLRPWRCRHSRDRREPDCPS